MPKWQKNQELLKVFGVRNRAGQTYFPKDKRVENYGEVVGSLVTFGAEGTFALPAGPLRAPCDLPVEIAAGGLTVFGKRFELPIAGPGLVPKLPVSGGEGAVHGSEDWATFRIPVPSGSVADILPEWPDSGLSQNGQIVAFPRMAR